MRSVVVVRHGERLDYVMRDDGRNWIPTSDRPWDPPLKELGHEQANALGRALPQILEDLRLPPIAAIYSSPFWRCRQTAKGLVLGGGQHVEGRRVQVELGLAESLNENWYRSWAVPGTDGSWGFQKREISLKELDASTLHPAAKDSVSKILDWRLAPADDALTAYMDFDHISKSNIDMVYCMDPPVFESYKMQRCRMHETLELLSSQHIDSSIVLVSHGGPVTHLFESLTTKRWDVHGVSKYCGYSIYIQEDENNSWNPLAVNQVLEEGQSSHAAKSTSFTWA